MRRLIPWLAVILLCIVTLSEASILGGEKADISLKKGTVTPGVTWSNLLSQTDSGLRWVPEGRKTQADIWIQTDKIPVGMSWRPPRWSQFTLNVDGYIDTEPYKLNAFIRYGCDGKHWSTWYIMDRQEENNSKTSHTYKCDITIPKTAYQSYEMLKREWTETKPDNSSDEDALCRWIATRDPTFFSREFPFLGYVQIRLETLTNRALFSNLKLRAQWSVGGLADRPLSLMGKKWHFEQK